MPEKKPNQLARVVAVLGLIAAFLAVAITVVTTSSSDGGDGGDDRERAEGEPTSKKGERALERGVWVVGEGDTLVSIAKETGLEVDQLEELNPEIDPQALSPGEKVSLLEASSDGEGGGSSAGGGGEDTITEGSGIGDEGPTGQATETDGFSD
ncbi:MAG: LysM peptidoglycan-binding domain-containing protein [Solirubrobacterales bacterium]